MDEFISSTSLWYPGDYPYNSTELFMLMDIMTWGQWQNASTGLGIFLFYLQYCIVVV